MKWDIAVIGGGPAGMMAAGTAASQGARVVLLEKNRNPGQKLLITGSGRCNLTNADPDPQHFLDHFGQKGKYFYSLFNIFGIGDTLRFFRDHGLRLVIEKNNQNKVFPASGRSADVLDVLSRYMDKNGVRVKPLSSVKKISVRDGLITEVELPEAKIAACSYILCTGGLSYPATGCTGDGFKFAGELGHTIVPLRPALVPVILKESWIHNLQGLTLQDAAFHLLKKDQKIAVQHGDAVFTSTGLSGPAIFDLSHAIAECPPDTATLRIDLLPHLNDQEADTWLQKIFQDHANKNLDNCLNMFLPHSLPPVLIRLIALDPQKKVNSITRQERITILRQLKHFTLRISRLAGYKQAMVTAGGVALNEIDLRTMRSKLIDNLFFAGEMIDIDGPTGGYNLQMCWTTGYCAGLSAAAQIKINKKDSRN